MAGRPARRARSPAHPHRAESLPLLQSEHALARRSARALRRRTNVARARGQRTPRLDRSPHPASANRPAGRRRRRPLRAVHALPPLHARLLLARADRCAQHRRRGGRPIRGRGRSPGDCGAAARRRPRPRAAHRRRRWGRADADARRRAGRPAPQPRRGRGAGGPAGPPDRDHARGDAVAPRSGIRTPPPAILTVTGRVRRTDGNGVLRLSFACGRPFGGRRRTARVPERRPRSRRRAVADVRGSRCAAAHRSGHRLLYHRLRGAGSHALHRAAQHADARRPFAVAAERTVSLVARRERPRPPLAHERSLRLLRRLA